jgi:23S rRNA (guanosine2251-2'-O)-methyltransferase
VVAGRRPVTEAIRAGLAKEVLVAEGTTPTEGFREVVEAAAAAQVPLRTAPRAELDALAPDHRGVLAWVTSAGPRPLSERELATFAFGDDAIVVVLDGLSDPQNLGAAARSAEAAGVSMLVTRTRRSADVTAAAIRSSAGALLHIPHARVANIQRAIGRLQEAGFTAVGLAEEAQDSIYDVPSPEGRVALVIGGEGEGLSRLTRERCDLLVSIPMLGRVASLNASATLAVALYGYVLASREAGHVSASTSGGDPHRC